jgi:hypothetical protein
MAAFAGDTDHHGRYRAFWQLLSQEAESAHSWHYQIECYDVRLQCFNQFQGLFGIAPTHDVWIRVAGMTVSSEVLDPGESGWHEVPDLSLLEATVADYSIRHCDQWDQGLS